MGIFLNSAAPYSLYESEVKKPYFVDKSLMLEELFLPAETGNSHICITRPRRFGKTVMANMVSAFFSHGTDSTKIFSKLKIAESAGYKKHLNTHDVIRIDFSRMPRNCNSYNQYIERIERILIQDLMEAYPKAGIQEADAVWDSLDLVYFSAMVVYGFLSSEEGKVRIPNRELMERFDEMLQKEPSLGYVYRLAKESKRMLEATLHGDTQVMEQILEYAHNTEGFKTT